MSDIPASVPPAPAKKKRPPARKTKPVPDKDAIALLPVFAGLSLSQIHVPQNEREFAAACDAILAAGTVGFDTESKPTFVSGDVSGGPHLLQFALPHTAYLFQIHHEAAHPFLIKLLSAAQLLKVGFGLQSDHKHIVDRLGVKPAGLLDLNRVFSMQGYHKEMGVRAAVAVVFGQRFAKSRKVTTSNWSQQQLSDAQLLYAANDAYAALKVFEALELSRGPSYSRNASGS